MSARPATLDPQTSTADQDQRVYFYNAPWSYYEVMLALRGDSSVPRMTCHEGVLELMSPSRGHEYTKRNLARLLEAYAEEIRLVLLGYGSWTLKNPEAKRGAEADECYCLEKPKEMPDLAIEVVYTSGGIDKLDVHRKLGVREVWFWQRGVIAVHELQGESYVPVARSLAFPELDLALIARLAIHDNPLEALDELRAWVRSGRTSS